MARKLTRSLCASLSLVIVCQLTVLLGQLVAADPTGTQCVVEADTCVCETADGKIDLTGLSNGDGASARFTDLGPDPNQFLYSYNPCMAFYSETCNDNVYICQEGTEGIGYSVAEDGSEQVWVDTDGTIYLYYTGPDNRETKVNLHCDMTKKDPEVTTNGDSEESLHYIFDITGCDVCPGGCDGSGPGGGGKDKSSGIPLGVVGIVIIILMIAGLVTYFVVGALIMKYRFKAAGTDIIPNKQLWFAFPFLLKDGCVFTFGPCVGLIRQKVQGKKGYVEIPP